MTQRARIIGILVLAAAVAAAPGSSRAQTGGVYDLSWNRIAAGGGRSADGLVYVLNGTAGQPEAGAHSGGAYLLQAGFWNGGVTATPVGEPGIASAGAATFRLGAGSPNPFLRETTVAFDLPRDAAARIDVFNVSGAHVATLVDGLLPAGRHEARWAGTDAEGRRVAQGVYVLRLVAGVDAATRKVVLAR